MERSQSQPTEDTSGSGGTKEIRPLASLKRRPEGPLRLSGVVLCPATAVFVFAETLLDAAPKQTVGDRRQTQCREQIPR